MKSPETGDIYLNPETLELSITYKNNFDGNWYLKLVHDTYQIPYEICKKYIYISNIYDLTKNKCEEIAKQIIVERGIKR